MNYSCNTILAAGRYAREKHEGQFRKYGDKVPYIYHPMRVAGEVVLTDEATPEMVAAAWLHDVIEDTDATHLDLVDRFGPHIADMVLGLTDITKQDKIRYASLPRVERKKANNEYLMIQSDEVKLIKLCDILDNVRDMPEEAGGFRKKFFEEKKIQTNLIGYINEKIALKIMSVIYEKEPDLFDPN